MRHFKNPSGQVFGYDETQSKLADAAIANGWQELDIWPLPKSQAEIDAEATAAAKAELVAIDLASIRSIREYLAAKPDAPQHLKDRETAAIAARARIK